MSADEYLASPWDYEGQTIKLNVAFVRPEHFQSPLPDVIFFHAMTLPLTASRAEKCSSPSQRTRASVLPVIMAWISTAETAAF
jgi:hypothetical protein